MTLKELIAADVTAVFLNSTSGFAETITHYPEGNLDNGEDITALVVLEEHDLDSPSGVEDSHGRRVRSDGVIDIAVSVNVSLTPIAAKASAFLIDGHIWRAIDRRDGRTSDLQSIFIVRHDLGTTRETRE